MIDKLKNYLIQKKDIDEYFKKKNYLSSSGLKNIELNKNYSKSRCYVSGDSFVVGSLADCWATHPHLEKELFIYSEIPTDGIIDVLFKYIETGSIEESVLNYGTKLKINSKYKDNIDKRWEKIKPYLGFIDIIKSGKEVVNEKRKHIARNAFDNVKHYWVDKFIYSKTPGLLNVYQYIIYTEYRGLKSKCMMDNLIINHTDKDIVIHGVTFPSNSFTVVDLKTGYKDSQWLKSYLNEYNVYLQLSWYTKLCKEHFPDLKVNLPIVVYCSTMSKTPSFKQLTKEELFQGKYGKIKGEVVTEKLHLSNYSNEKVLGFETFIDIKKELSNWNANWRLSFTKGRII